MESNRKPELVVVDSPDERHGWELARHDIGEDALAREGEGYATALVFLVIGAAAVIGGLIVWAVLAVAV